jgi:hypothetical protein
MREQLRSLIEQARRESGSRTNPARAQKGFSITERLGTDAVRLARIAAALHLAGSLSECER